uniref:Glucosyltransferase 3 n=1 Tax=Crocus sativus TaxID=82528 RepID=A0A0A8K949_CROSA|nr:glucosyltransferase 3 [Crocus sativus]
MNGSKGHVMVFCYPIQGHITPFVQFAKRLGNKGIVTTFIVADNHCDEGFTCNHFNLTAMASYPLDDGMFESDGFKVNFLEMINKFDSGANDEVTRMLDEYKIAIDPAKGLIHSPFLCFLSDIARNFQIYAVAMFTQPWLGVAGYYHLNRSAYDLPASHDCHTLASFPSMPVLCANDLPSFVSNLSCYPSLHELIIEQMSNLERGTGILPNTFGNLEEKVLKWMAQLWPVSLIAPLAPMFRMSKALQPDKSYDMDCATPRNADNCMEWLNSEPGDSVVYLSFGTIVNLCQKQLNEIAGLINCGRPFIWAVREEDQHTLPEGFLEEIKGRALVVGWGPQEKILAHGAVACFVTHCGWNSSLELLAAGVPAIAYGKLGDQITNAKFLTDVYGVGVRLRAPVTREEFLICVEEVTEGEKAERIRERSSEMKRAATEAVAEGGPSDKNIQAIGDEIMAIHE